MTNAACDHDLDSNKRRGRLHSLHAAILEKNRSALMSLLTRDTGTSTSTTTTRVAAAVEEEEDPAQLLWEPNRSRRTAMHVAARCLLEDQFEPGSTSRNNNNDDETALSSVDLWRFLLEKAAAANDSSNNGDNKFLIQRDKSGETCLDIFMNSWLAPPIGSSTVFRSFAASLELLLEETDRIQRLRDWIHKELYPTNGNCCSFPNSDPHINMVARFWRAFELICRAATRNSRQFHPNHDSSSWSNGPPCPILPLLACLGSCPGPIAHLVVTIFPHQAQTAVPAVLMSPKQQQQQQCLLSTLGKSRNNENNKDSDDVTAGITTARRRIAIRTLPLHLWAQSRNPSDPDRDNLLSTLLQVYPHAIMYADDTSHRLPLHWALECGKPLHSIPHLWMSHPHVLQVMDPVTHLPPFCLTAMAVRKEERACHRSLEKRGPSVSLHEWLSERNERDRHEFEPRLNAAAAARLTVLYEMIRAYPATLLRNNLAKLEQQHQE